MDSAVFQTSASTEIQYGVQYPDGRVDWQVHTWFGTIDTAERRAAFAEQYRLQMVSFGVPGVEVSFLHREVTTTTHPAEYIVDRAPEPPADPEPETPEAPTDPEVPAESETPAMPADPDAPAESEDPEAPADSETPAAPEEDAEPPAEDAPTEEESPVEESNPVGNDTEPLPTDDEGVTTDGG